MVYNKTSTLSCCIVVKNEQKKIASCMNNLFPLADEIVIVDTGSTDNTVDIINNWVTDHKFNDKVKIIKVGSRFHDSDGDFNFGAAKTFALINATMDFVMWVDVTDVIESPEKLRLCFIHETKKNKNIYFVLPTALSDKFAYIRNRIGPRDTSVIVGRIHEFMTFTNVDKLKRVFIPISIHNKKKTRDLNRNLRILIKEWNEKKAGRIAFYIALTYRELKKMKESFDWFKCRVYTFDFLNEFKEEYFKALESICELVVNSLVGEEYYGDLMDASTKMVEICPDRVEGYYYIAVYWINRDDPTKALSFLKTGLTCKKPDQYKLWLNDSIYIGNAMQNLMDKCKTAITYKNVLIPDKILDYNETASGVLKIGNQQYF